MSEQCDQNSGKEIWKEKRTERRRVYISHPETSESVRGASTPQSRLPDLLA